MVGYHIIVERDKGRKTPEDNFSAQHFIYGMLAFTPSLHIYSTAEQSVGFSPIIFSFLAPTVFCGCFFVLSRISQEKFVKQTTKAVQNLHSDTAL